MTTFQSNRTNRARSGSMRSKKKADLRSPPADALKRVEAAAVSDLTVARLTLGLFATLAAGITDASRRLFPGYRGGLTACRLFPKTLQRDLWALIDWALVPKQRELFDMMDSAERIEKAVRRLRTNSPLGRQFRRRARRLMNLHPELPKGQWNPCGKDVELMPDAIGQPLNEGIVKLAAAFGSRHMQIVPHRATRVSGFTPGVLTIRLAVDGYTVAAIILAVKAPDDEERSHPRRIEGTLHDFFETGTEGVIWSIASDDRVGYAALETINEGDHLTILDQLGATLWRA